MYECGIHGREFHQTLDISMEENVYHMERIVGISSLKKKKKMIKNVLNLYPLTHLSIL